MLRILSIIVLLYSCINASINIDEKSDYLTILQNSKIYIDKSNTLTYEEIQTKTFYKNDKATLAYGFSPKFSVWVKFTLKNISDKPIQKLLQYNHEVTSDIEFFDGDKKKIKGFFHSSGKELSLTPSFQLNLLANESRTYYLKVQSIKNFLIIRLNIWDSAKFYKEQSDHQFILALFFGAFGLLIIYNLFIFFSIKDKSYLWYVLYLFFVLVNLFFYKGLMYKFDVGFLGDFAKVYGISFPISVIALSLFMRSFLNIKQYPMMDKIFYFLTTILFILVLINFINLFSILGLTIDYCYILILYIFFIICYSVYKKNRQAYFIIAGWLIMLISMILFYLSIKGIYDFLSYSPFIIEMGIFLEAILFSFALADRIKILQQKLLLQQQNEKQRLSIEVERKTKDLNLALNEKEILLRELLHRVKNNMQFISSLYALKLENANEQNISEKLQDVERKILAMSEVHQLLYTQQNIQDIDATKYFKKIVQTIKDSFILEDINFILKIDTTLEMEEAIYCGLIVNELITNAIKYAFPTNKGEITVRLNEDRNFKYLCVKDNGIGIKADAKDGFGNTMTEALVKTKLKGKIKIENLKGAKIEIIFPNNPKRNAKRNANFI